MTLALSNSPIGADFSTQDILTERLALVAVTPEMLRADFSKSPEFSRLIHAEVPSTWPSDGWDEDAYNYLLTRLEQYPNYRGWSRYIMVKADQAGGRTLAGGCGLLGPIELTDDPEIGYGLLSEFQRQGLATEAVDALTSWIFEHPHVKSVNAQTFPDHATSLRVLAKSGFQPAGAGREEGTILFRRFRE
jgi:RimJ/RimL family protein N-acetyltransferase